MMSNNPRVTPLEMKQIPEDLKTPSKWFKPPESGSLAMFEASPGLANVQRVLANNPQLMMRWMGFAHYLLNESSISLRDRELVILRVAVIGEYHYEWGQHVEIAKRACNFTDEDFEKILKGSEHAGWAEGDKLLIKMIEELMTQRVVSGETWDKMIGLHSLEQMMDLVFLVGNYSMLGMAINTFEVPLDDGLNPIPVY